MEFLKNGFYGHVTAIRKRNPLRPGEDEETWRLRTDFDGMAAWANQLIIQLDNCKRGIPEPVNLWAKIKPKPKPTEEQLGLMKVFGYDDE